jgi:hypothetical protein
MADIGHSLEIGPEVLTAAIGRQRFLYTNSSEHMVTWQMLEGRIGLTLVY